MLRNIIANFIGRFWSVLSNYLFIPLYIRFLGIESYSIISFSLVLLGIMSLLDAGMTATLSREFANKSLETKDKLKTLATLEIIYSGIAIFLVFAFLLGANTIATQFIKVNTININELILSIKILGLGIAFQMLANFYMGGLIGLEYQVKANVYQILWGILRNGLVVLIIWYFPSILYFFSWQVFITFIYALILRQSLIKILLSTDPSVFYRFNFDKNVLEKTRRFAGGMLLISVVAAINTQLDKLAISNLLPIEELGYYTLAFALAQGLLVLVNPIATSTLPRFTALFSESKRQEASELFFNLFAIACIIVFSLAAVLIFYSHLIIYIWTGNQDLANNSYSYVPYLVIGTGLLAILVIPFNIAIANGYTKLNNIIGIVSVFFTIPIYWLAVTNYGSKGAAISWMTLQILITPIYIYYINKKFLIGFTTSQLLGKQLLIPFISATIATFLMSSIIPMSDNKMINLLIIGITSLMTLFTTAFISLPKNSFTKFYFFYKKKLFDVTIAINCNSHKK
jgi:O-antigen/teichoic acid export membrane protein